MAGASTPLYTTSQSVIQHRKALEEIKQREAKEQEIEALQKQLAEAEKAKDKKTEV